MDSCVVKVVTSSIPLLRAVKRLACEDDSGLVKIKPHNQNTATERSIHAMTANLKFGINNWYIESCVRCIVCT